MPRKRKQDVPPIEEVIRLSSEVTVIVKASPVVYDALDIRRVGGVISVALPGSQPFRDGAPPPPSPNPDARRALAERFPGGPSASEKPNVVTPQSLGFEPMTPESLTGGGNFAGISNEDEESDA